VRLQAHAIAVAVASAFVVFGCSLGETAQPPLASFAVAPQSGSAPSRAPREALTPREAALRCPDGMAEIPVTGREHAFCIDRWEASLVEVLPGGAERPYSPFALADGHTVRAVTAPGVYPHGYVSALQASRACAQSEKRLCKSTEWRRACRGPEEHAWGYGDRREPGRCNDNGRNPITSVFGMRLYTPYTMNAPQLNQVPGTLARTGERAGCTNGFGVFDMVGNLHEWIADSGGTFYGGYYQDVASLGHGAGCGYATVAHSASYHDYSTGFRCCSDL
jgi:formylglycine-generating enzyme required for sulfatase activity